jgi:hypothetical protein
VGEDEELSGEKLVKEVNRLIRLARAHWDAHDNAACRGERAKALELYSKLSKEQKEAVPQVLRIWLRYRSEKYFGEGRTPPGAPIKGRSPGRGGRKGRAG